MQKVNQSICGTDLFMISSLCSSDPLSLFALSGGEANRTGLAAENGLEHLEHP
jgi:hypothetical protein